MKIVRNEDLLAEAGISPTDTITLGVEAACLQATLQLETDLRTSFRRRTYETVWSLSSVDAQNKNLLLRLNAGFVASDPAPTGGTLHVYSQVRDQTNLDMANVLFDWAKGTARILDSNLNAYVCLHYTAGFSVSSTDPSLYDESQVPDALREAAMLLAMINFSQNPELDTAKGGAIDTKGFKERYTALVLPFIRYTPMALFPLA